MLFIRIIVFIFVRFEHDTVQTQDTRVFGSRTVTFHCEADLRFAQPVTACRNFVIAGNQDGIHDIGNRLIRIGTANRIFAF